MAQLYVPYFKRGSLVSFNPFQASSSDFEDTATAPSTSEAGQGPPFFVFVFLVFRTLKIKCSHELIY